MSSPTTHVIKTDVSVDTLQGDLRTFSSPFVVCYKGTGTKTASDLNSTYGGSSYGPNKLGFIGSDNSWVYGSSSGKAASAEEAVTEVSKAMGLRS